ncbi:MFS transporter [Actinomadura sp. WAC 06369]|nr:MFS transporter [Actinomadura sp. WAC 06369]
MSHAQPRSAEREVPAPVRVNLVVAVLAFSGIVVSLMQTLVIPIVPDLPRLLDASAADAAWAVTATLLAAAVATPVSGRLGDMYGKRLMLLVSVAAMVAGSVTAGLSDTLPPMIVARVLQGLSAGVIPLGISIMRDELPAERLPSAIALMSASLGVGGAFGMPAAALIADTFDWHALFWFSAGLGGVAFLLVLTLVPESRMRTGGRFDLVGAAGMAIGLVCLLLAISQGADWGWTSGTTLGLFGAAAAVLLVWGAFELRVRDPLVDLRTTARRQVLVTNIASIAIGFSMFAMSLVIPQVVQLPVATGHGLGESLLVAGLVMMPGGLVMMATAPVSAAVSRSAGPKTTLMAGALIVAAGYGVNILLMEEIWHLVLATCVISAGIGFAYGAMPTLIMGAVPASESGAANSLNTLMRSIGTSVASAAAGVILAEMVVSLGGVPVPSEDGFKAVMGAGAGAALLAFAIAALIPRRRPAARPPASGTAAEGAPGGGAREPAAAADVKEEALAAARGPGAAVAPAAPAGPGPAVPSGAPDGTGAAGIPVTGHVRGAEGAPVAGAAVTLISQAGRQVGRAVAHRDGAYVLTAPDTGSYVLIASADGHQPQAASIAVGGAPVAHDVLLGGTSGLSGAVRSVPGGAPVAGAVVIVTDVRGDVLATAETGPRGEFAVADLVPGAMTLAVNAPGHRPQAVPVEVGAGAATRVEVELRAGAHVRGTVRGAGAPLGGARVTLVDAAGNAVATTTTGPDGAYAFSDLDGGAYTVIATGYPPRATAVTVTGSGLDGHDIDLAHGDG